MIRYSNEAFTTHMPRSADSPLVHTYESAPAVRARLPDRYNLVT